MVGFESSVAGVELWRFSIDRGAAILAGRTSGKDKASRPIECDDFDFLAHVPSKNLISVGADVGVARIDVELRMENYVGMEAESAFLSSRSIERQGFGAGRRRPRGDSPTYRWRPLFPMGRPKDGRPNPDRRDRSLQWLAPNRA